MLASREGDDDVEPSGHRPGDGKPAVEFLGALGREAAPQDPAKGFAVKVTDKGVTQVELLGEKRSISLDETNRQVPHVVTVEERERQKWYSGTSIPKWRPRLGRPNSISTLLRPGLGT